MPTLLEPEKISGRSFTHFSSHGRVEATSSDGAFVDKEVLTILRLAVAFSLALASAPRVGLAADLDGDGDSDLRDFSRFQLAFTGPGLTSLPSQADLNLDEHVDLLDYRIFFGGLEDADATPRPAPDEQTQPLGRTLLWLLFMLLLYVCFERADRDNTTEASSAAHPLR